MRNIYEYKSINKIIEAYIKHQAFLGQKTTQSSISNALNMQKSYFSKIMSQNAFLNKDQVYLLSKVLKLDEKEFSYLNLICDYEKSGIAAYKSELLKKIDAISNKNTQSEKYLSKKNTAITTEGINRYYSDEYSQLIHLCLGIKRFQAEPKKLISLFKINEKKYLKIIKNLEELNLIQVNEKNIKLISSNLHLSRESNLFSSWYKTNKLNVLSKLDSLDDEEKYNFIANFSCDQESKEKIRVEFLSFLKKVEKIVKDAPAKELYHLGFDLIKWT
ncbi:MAG: DUF4423 domain-containing protein [Bacteriovoracaceae bacterium]|nr:DUF4423 domain-containing protein [Bacteriovoracaceae bacterium]